MKNISEFRVTHTAFTGYFARLTSMLALLLSLFYCTSGLHAQSNSEYNFTQMQSIVSNTFDSADCDQLQWEVHSIAQSQNYQKEYDSARYAIEHCAIFDTILFLSLSSDFGIATAGCQYMSNDNDRWPTYREWLKKVLYLTINDGYYCSDVESILSTFQYFNSERGNDANGYLAVIKFLQDSQRCMGFSFMDPKKWALIRQDQYQSWRDTLKSPNTSPVDTTLPTLEDLDLQILRGPQFAAVKDAFTPSSKTKIEYLIASDNPFKEETTLRFGLADAEYMKIELYDLLGNKIYSDSKLFGEGDEQWRIDGKSLPKGTTYARLMTMGGEVKTVKLVHEK